MLALDSPGIVSMVLMLFSCTVASCKRDANYQSSETPADTTIAIARELHCQKR